MSINNNGYTRCHYISDNGEQCSTWYKFEEEKPDPNHCPAHEGIVSTRLAVARGEEQKQEYMDFVNSERAFISEFRLPDGSFDFDRLREHKAAIEKEIEKQRTRLITARAIESDEVQKLSDDERVKLKKHQITKPAIDEIKKVSAKKDPLENLIGTLMKTGQSRELAEKHAKSILGV